MTGIQQKTMDRKRITRRTIKVKFLREIQYVSKEGPLQTRPSNDSKPICDSPQINLEKLKIENPERNSSERNPEMRKVQPRERLQPQISEQRRSVPPPSARNSQSKAVQISQLINKFQESLIFLNKNFE